MKQYQNMQVEIFTLTAKDMITTSGPNALGNDPAVGDINFPL